MKGYAFYAEMPDHWASKSANKYHPAFTRATLGAWADKDSKCNVVAVLLPRDEHNAGSGCRECLSATFDYDDSHASTGAISCEVLAKRCVRIDEVLARRLHPRLFARIDAEESRAKAPRAKAPKLSARQWAKYGPELYDQLEVCKRALDAVGSYSPEDAAAVLAKVKNAGAA